MASIIGLQSKTEYSKWNDEQSQTTEQKVIFKFSRNYEKAEL